MGENLMNNKDLDFKFQISGPFTPVHAVEGQNYFIKSRVATLETVLKMADFCSSLLIKDCCDFAMTKSLHNSQIMMGEIDEPIEDGKLNSLGLAGLFGIGFVFQTIDTTNTIRNRKLSLSKKQSACSIVTMLLLFMRENDSVLAKYASYLRTGYLCEIPSDADNAMIPKMRDFVRRVSRNVEEIECFFKENLYDIPLQKRLYGYDKQFGHYWSQPIEIPEINCSDDDY